MEEHIPADTGRHCSNMTRDNYKMKMLNNPFFWAVRTSPENCHLVTLAVWGRRSRMRVRSTSVRWMWRCQRGGASRKALSSRSMRMILTSLNRWACSLDGNAGFHLSHTVSCCFGCTLSWFLSLQMEDSEGTVRQIGAFSEGIQNLTVRLSLLEPYPTLWILLDVYFLLCC